MMLRNEIPWDKGSPHLFYPTGSQCQISQSYKGSASYPLVCHVQPAKMSFCTVFCLEMFSSFVVFFLSTQKPKKQMDSSDPQQKALQTWCNTKESVPAAIHPPRVSRWPGLPRCWSTNVVFGGTFHTALLVDCLHSIAPTEEVVFSLFYSSYC